MLALTVCLSGLMFGALHVLVGPDHLAALAPFSVEARGKAWTLGLRWGLGHSAGIVGVGIIVYLIQDRIDLDLLAGLGRYAVGVILIGIGVWGFAHMRRMEFGTRVLEPDDRHLHTTAAFLVGSVHGVAGTGYLLGVLPLLAMPGWVEASAYLTGFAGGTILAMILFSSLLGLVGRGSGARAVRTYRRVFAATSAAALVVGIAWITLPLIAAGVSGD